MTTFKYLLSTGKATTKVEEYIIDLFKIFLTLYPGDVPHYENLGFNFIITEVTKDNLKSEITSMVNDLIEKIRNVLPGSYTITINTLDLIDEETVKLIIDVDGTLSEEIYINIYDEET